MKTSIQHSIIYLFLLCFYLNFAYAQSPDRIEPPMWWTGMQNPDVTLMIHGKAISTLHPVIDYKGVTLKTVTKTENPNYLFLEVTIDGSAIPGKVPIRFYKDKKLVSSFDYLLQARSLAAGKGFGPEDVVYLLMPDRFANGNPANDQVDGLIDKLNRTNPTGRHGGDIQGIINRLDYLKDLGITAIWTTPLLEDNMDSVSYHTYAITDYFKIDQRYGNNEDYIRLAEECHKRGMKLIMDMVPNHCGSNHWWMKDMPMKDWIHRFPEFTRSNYTISTWNDPHASQNDIMLNEDGWFDVSMPDLNQNNPLLLNYLKQWAVFWVEYAKLDGLRVDTYPFNNKIKIAEWTKAIRNEYPEINIMGECVQHQTSEVAYWQSGVENYDGYDSGLPTVMDFPLLDAFMAAFNENSSGTGVSRFYNLYANDYLYANMDNILVFLDNHDSQRFSTQIEFNLDKYKMGVAHLLTTRGIPQIYTGTEIMMGGSKSNGDGDIRWDFPGGWAEDPRNAFSSEGRSAKENEAFNYMRTLLNYRKNNPVLHTGKMVQFIPRDNVYVYFRLNDQKTVMVIMNNSALQKSVNMNRFEECLKGSKKGTNIIDGKEVSLTDLKINPLETMIIEISR